MVAYVGSRGVHQPFRVDDARIFIPGKTSAGYLWPKVDVFGNFYTPQCNATDPNGPPDPDPPYVSPRIPTTRIMAQFVECSIIGRSYFNALELQLAKRNESRPFRYQGTYTWARALTLGSANSGRRRICGNAISSLHFFDMKLNRAPSDFNVGRTFVVTARGTFPHPSHFPDRESGSPLAVGNSV